MIDTLTLSGVLKKKSGLFGMWKSCYCSLNQTRLVIYKGRTKEVDFQININPETEISMIQNEKNPRISIKYANEMYYFMANTVDELEQWVQALRSATYFNAGICLDDFEIISVIGRGFYGKVTLVKHKESNELFALKSVHKKRLLSENKTHTIIAEKNILIKTSHPFIVGLKFTFQTESKLYLGLEFVPGGDFYNYLRRRKFFPPGAVRLYAAEIALALNHLHSLGVIYRDLKPENVLIDKEGHIRLTDFGLAKPLDISNDEETTSTFCGTNEYLAPELVLSQDYSYPIDWWALGILMYEMSFGRPPFADRNRKQLFIKILKETPSFPIGTSPELIDIIKLLLEKSPSKRASFAKIASHKYFEKIQFSQLEKKQITPPIRLNGSTLDNFDSTFTSEDKQDSTVSIASSGNEFLGFSYMDEIGLLCSQRPLVN